MNLAEIIPSLDTIPYEIKYVVYLLLGLGGLATAWKQILWVADRYRAPRVSVEEFQAMKFTQTENVRRLEALEHRMDTITDSRSSVADQQFRKILTLLRGKGHGE